MAKGRPFIPEHDRRRSERDNSRIRTPYRHLIDPQDPYYYEICIELMQMQRAGVEINETVADIATKVVRHKLGTEEELEARRRANEAKQQQETQESVGRWIDYRKARDHWKESTGIVYYILRGDFIKIGTTTRPTSRFDTLMPDAVLATEPGDVELEKKRHEQFAATREMTVGREYFRPEAALINLIHRLRGEHGIPDIPHASLVTRETAAKRVAEILAHRPKASVSSA
ncbi:hypothetical protein ACFXKI_01085 [Streptomyces mirabilis]|uniref:hypothetical protein n=1 Tax=Streptomyces mirabilis TaxID=68239 RepID=UPI0036CF7407